MFKKLLTLAAIAALSLSANAEKIQIECGNGASPTFSNLKLTSTKQWAEYYIVNNASLSTTDYTGIRIEYSDVTLAENGGWQLKVVTTVTGDDDTTSEKTQYPQISSTDTSKECTFSNSGTITTISIQSKAAGDVINISKVELIKADNKVEEVVYGSPYWGMTVGLTDPYSAAIKFASQYSAITLLDESGNNLSFTKGNAAQTYQIDFDEATPVKLLVDFGSGKGYGEINEGVSTNSVTFSDSNIDYYNTNHTDATITGISSVEIKANDADKTNQVVKFKSITRITSDATAVDNIRIADNDAPVEYFNLQGVRVANPQNGLYIRRQGNKASKVLLK